MCGSNNCACRSRSFTNCSFRRPARTSSSSICFVSACKSIFAVSSTTPPTSSTFNGIRRTPPFSTGSRPKTARASFKVTRPAPYWSTARFVISSLSSISERTLLKSTPINSPGNSPSMCRLRNRTILLTSGIIFSE